MTKKHFVAFAEYIRKEDLTDAERAKMIDMVIFIAKRFNGDFDSMRFRKAAEKR